MRYLPLTGWRNAACRSRAVLLAVGLLLPAVTLAGADQDPPWISKFPALEARVDSVMSVVNAWTGSASETLADYDPLFEAVQRHASAYWQDVRLSQTRTLVAYDDNWQSRSEIDFEHGRVTIETLRSGATTEELTRLIEKTLASPVDDSALDSGRLSDTPTDGIQGVLAGQVRDQEGKSVEYAWRAKRYARWLATHRVERSQQADGSDILRINIPLSSNHLRVRAQQFVPAIEKASHRHKVDPALVMAIIATESSFNPYAVSHIPAFGLMQIVPRTAGHDVFNRVYRKAGKPDRDYLFNAGRNIDVGTAYLGLLNHVYLKGINDPVSRRLCVIAAYNGGAGNVYKTFGGGKKKALARINSLSSQQVYNRLRTHHPADETRRYVKKVKEARTRFRPLIVAGTT
ncbi:murein transglycosylase domain-containing protein [Larsenimonas rhizosphaerae]|uniref:Murein transglycosylase domain-containing protein n=1 Tax=Larsenimonas rhizosphaerae TaxID=2944682 RepID=A0AA42CTQ1_9GAMM|nr:murein transglycosylase domain-containing protein [Larsenimonas rhizosphaerae]MCX2523474.1 murein transglycosylase domain-containing protein [Larsenimonas rhizosphaerae]